MLIAIALYQIQTYEFESFFFSNWSLNNFKHTYHFNFNFISFQFQNIYLFPQLKLNSGNMNEKLCDSRQSNFWFEKKVCSGLKQGKQSKPWLKDLKHFEHRQILTDIKITKSPNNLIEAFQPDTIRTKSGSQMRCMFQLFFIPCTPEYYAYSHDGYGISLLIFFPV